MKTTYHSEYLKLKSVFIKSAKNAFVSEIHLSQQWKELNYLSRPDFEEAITEYEFFEKYFIAKNIELLFFLLIRM